MKPSLLSLRAVVLLSLGMVGGVVTAALSLLAGHAIAESLLGGVAGAGGMITFLDRIVATEVNCTAQAALPQADASEEVHRHV
ncbi:hypothetical protein ACFTZI_02305 [Streptomyces decoyicus]|uniref:hypothetical protein n=1 Tax=Streptomyces decoyicus TaxID=249567 RepID=UPI003627A986